MARSALPLLTAGEAHAADAMAIASGTPANVLMTRAAGHLARTVLAVAAGGAGLRVDIVVGRGDNGGDGWAAAPLLSTRGAKVRVIAPDGVDTQTSTAAADARARWIAAGGVVCVGDVAPHLLRDDGRARAAVVVDCLLGTGGSGRLRGSLVEAAAAVNAARVGGATVVACDIPSGTNPDDGSTTAGAVVADVTITFGALKRGLLIAPGATHCGSVHVGHIGVHSSDAIGPRWWMLTSEGVRPALRDPLEEKRRRGVVLIIAGRVGTAGAAVLAGRGALAAGAGLVTLAVPEPVRAEVAAMHPAVMTVGLPADADGGAHAEAVHALPLDGVDMVVAGPGMGTGRGTEAIVAYLRERCHSLVLDADALNVFSDSQLMDSERPPRGALVLTPHERELDRLAGVGTYADRAVRVPELAARWGAHVVAKGPWTLSAAPDETVHVSPFAVPALATGGTGDVLAGMLGATLAGPPRHRDDVARVVARTVWWHAAAGTLAGLRSGGRTDATGLLAAIPSLFALLDAEGGPRPTVRDPGPRGRTVLDDLLLGPLLERPSLAYPGDLR